jgi:tRNA (cmo5U34)-methyltransferase
VSEWKSPKHASAYLERADRIPHKSFGYAAMLEEIPLSADRVLDLGSGDGRLLASVLQARPQARGVAVDFSPFMLEQLNARFASMSRVEVVNHDLEFPLPFHHLAHERKRQLYHEVWGLLGSGGVFCNLEHVASASSYGHERFLDATGTSAAEEDPSNKLLDVHTQLEWLREIGFTDVDCYWKWRELALLMGRKK